MAELRLSGKDRNKSITTKAAKELIAIKGRPWSPSRSRRNCSRSWSSPHGRPRSWLRRIMDDEDERKEEGNESPAELVRGGSIGELYPSLR